MEVGSLHHLAEFGREVEVARLSPAEAGLLLVQTARLIEGLCSLERDFLF